MDYHDDRRCAHAGRAQTQVKSDAPWLKSEIAPARKGKAMPSGSQAKKHRHRREKRCIMTQKRNSAGTEGKNDAPWLKNEIAAARKGKATYYSSKAE